MAIHTPAEDAPRCTRHHVIPAWCDAQQVALEHTLGRSRPVDAGSEPLAHTRGSPTLARRQIPANNHHGRLLREATRAEHDRRQSGLVLSKRLLS